MAVSTLAAIGLSGQFDSNHVEQGNVEETLETATTFVDDQDCIRPWDGGVRMVDSHGVARREFYYEGLEWTCRQPVIEVANVHRLTP